MSASSIGVLSSVSLIKLKVPSIAVLIPTCTKLMVRVVVPLAELVKVIVIFALSFMLETINCPPEITDVTAFSIVQFVALIEILSFIP